VPSSQLNIDECPAAPSLFSLSLRQPSNPLFFLRRRIDTTTYPSDSSTPIIVGSQGHLQSTRKKRTLFLQLSSFLAADSQDFSWVQP
jgi:hypothetical protein